MKVTTEDNVKQYILDKINNIYIGFDDNTEVKLSHIAEYDIDLDNSSTSTISFKNVISDIEIENRFKGNKSNHIICVYIEATGIVCENNRCICEKTTKVLYDIPCDMKIRRYQTDAVCGEVCGYMFVELEGYVK